MNQIYAMLKTVPSGSHNAPYSAELGNHWPARTKFKRLGVRLQNWYRKLHGGKNTYFQQIDGEEVVISIPDGRIGEFLRPYESLDEPDGNQ